VAHLRESFVKLSDDAIALLRQPSRCFLATMMADGSPQVTQVWGDTDGEHVVINSARGHVKVTNMARDPRVAIAIADPDDPWRYVQVRGRVIEITTEGAADHIERLSQKYLGTPYPWYSGRDQVRVIVVIEPEHVSGRG
jgi:PPOX class probable F420-dependent enzyme